MNKIAHVAFFKKAQQLHLLKERTQWTTDFLSFLAFRSFSVIFPPPCEVKAQSRMSDFEEEQREEVDALLSIFSEEMTVKPF